MKSLNTSLNPFDFPFESKISSNTFSPTFCIGFLNRLMMSPVVSAILHRDDEKYYLQLLEEGRKTERKLYGYNLQNWEEQKYLSRLRRQKKKQDKEIQQLEIYWATERAKEYTSLDKCPF